MTGRLIVLTAPELELGYRLAGVETRVVDSPEGTAEALTELLDDGDRGDVIAVHEPFLHALAPPLRRRLDTIVSPLVVALPSGEETDAELDRRAQQLRMLWQAVGYEITFGEEAER